MTLRYSGGPRNEPEALPAKKGGLEAAGGPHLLERVQKSSTARERKFGVLLVGGSSAVDMAVRFAQAHLRFDQYPSDWSHAALVLDWPDKGGLMAATGMEVTLAPEDPAAQIPATNGVTELSLARYADEARYPNVAFLSIQPQLPATRKKGGRSRASYPWPSQSELEPNGERLRFPFWEWLGPWHAHTHAPNRVPNPLTDGIPHPAAAMIQWAFEMAGVDLFPGAVDPSVCPEVLWATAVHWSDRVAPASSKIRYWAARGQRFQGPT